METMDPIYAGTHKLQILAESDMDTKSIVKYPFTLVLLVPGTYLKTPPEFPGIEGQVLFEGELISSTDGVLNLDLGQT